MGGRLGIPYRQSGWLAVESGSAHLGISDVLGSDDFVPPPRAWPIVVYLPEWCLHRGAHGGHTASRQPAELGLTRRERIPPENMMGVQSPSGTAPRLSRHVGLLDPAGGGRCALLVRPICRFLVGLYCGLSGFRVDQCFRRRERHRIEGWHLSRDRKSGLAMKTTRPLAPATMPKATKERTSPSLRNTRGAEPR